MHTIKEAIIVEGRYDLIRLSEVLNGIIIKTNGFSVFKDKEKIEGIKTLAKTTGIVILTDPDSAGFKIRNFIKQSVSSGRVLHAYIPDISGKERRKEHPSKEGLLGVEGVGGDVIIKALKDAGCEIDGQALPPCGKTITKADLFNAGLSGKAESRLKRQKLCAMLSLPSKISSNMLVAVLNRLMNTDQFYELSEKI